MTATSTATALGRSGGHKEHIRGGGKRKRLREWAGGKGRERERDRPGKGVDTVSAGCCSIQRSLMKRLGGMDTSYTSTGKKKGQIGSAEIKLEGSR